MIEHILVVIDSIPQGDSAIAHAAMLGTTLGARLTLVSGLHPSLYEAVRHDATKRLMYKVAIENRLNEMAAHLRNLGLSVRRTMLDCLDAPAVLEYAQQNDIHLMITANKGQRVTELVHTLAANQHLPLLITRQDGAALDFLTVKPYETILLPFDGSLRAEDAFPLATGLARAFRARLLIAQVVRKPRQLSRLSLHDPLTIEELEVTERLIDYNRRAAANYLQKLEHRLPASVETRLLVSEQVADSLHRLAEAEQADLIVIATHGASGNPQWSYGSVANSFIAYSPRPVLVIPVQGLADTAQTEEFFSTEIDYDR